MSTLSDIFNPTGATVVASGNKDLYRVSFKDGKSGVYSSVIRFIPYFANPSKSIMQKRVSYVKNPVTQRAMYIDDPKGAGQATTNPITDMFFKLRNTGIKQYEDFGKAYLSSKEQYASLVQILKDDQHPDLVGQIKVFVYGKKLWEKLYNEEHPQVGQGANPFHPIYGRHFALVCKAQGEFNNFDQSYFFDEKNAQQQNIPSGMWILNPATNNYEVVTEQTDTTLVTEYLSQNSPDLGKYDYRPWTDEQTAFVNEVLAISQNYVNTGVLRAVESNASASEGIQPVQPAQAVQPVQLNMSASPVFPGAVAQPATPQFSNTATGGVSMGANIGVQNQGGTVIGATAPTVAPAAAAPTPQVGINMDDILSQI